MADLTDAASERGRLARLTEPRAASARYDRRRDRVIVELTNGRTFTFPPRLARGLESATADQLAEVELLGAGYGLHLETLDADLSIPGLLAGRFGTEAHMAASGGQWPVGEQVMNVVDDEIVAVALAGIADIEAGRYVTVATPRDAEDMHQRAMARLRERLACHTID